MTETFRFNDYLKIALTGLSSVLIFIAVLAITGLLVASFGVSFILFVFVGVAYISWRHGRWFGLVLGLAYPTLVFHFVQMIDGDTSGFASQGLGVGAIAFGVMGFMAGIVAEQVARSRKAEGFAKLSIDVLQIISADNPLPETMTGVILRVEQDLAGGSCSILTLDRKSGKLEHAAAPGLPDDYCRAIDGGLIGEASGSSGAAAFRNEPVIVSNIQTDPLWRDFSVLAKQFDLKACWSIPIRDAKHKVLGTFDTYYDHKRAPTDHELSIVSEATKLVAIALIRDRDREKQQEFQRQVQTTQKLESLGRLAGGIAHDFNNMLAVIIGNAELLSLVLQSPEYNDSLAGILNAAHRASNLSNQIMIYSGSKRGEITNVDLSSMVEKLQPLIAAANPDQVNLQLELTSDLPAVRADETQLHQILHNLVTNAIEATAGEYATVVVRTFQQQVSRETLDRALHGNNLEPGTFICIEVEDNGSGISDEIKANIFDPFFSTKSNGRGLGLAVIFGALKRCNGALLLESTEGKGTLFRVMLADTSSE